VAFAAGAAPVASEKVIALAQGGLQTMSLSKLKMAVVVIVLVGLAGTGASWLMSGPGKAAPDTSSATAAEAGPARDRPAKEGRRGRGNLADRARDELRHLEVQTERADLELSDREVKTRQRLVELEERLRVALEQERMNQAPSPDEVRLQREEERLKESIDRAEQLARRREVVRPLEEQLEKVRQQRQRAAKERVARGTGSRESPVDLRKQMVRLEEDIRLVERKRAALMREADRKREAVAELLSREEGRAADADDRRLRDVQRRLDSIQRELGELRREIERLRAGRKR
jgi:hypothetical protein